VVSGVAWTGSRNLEDALQLGHFVEFRALPVAAPEACPGMCFVAHYEVKIGLLHETYHEEEPVSILGRCPGASLVYEPYEEMHGMTAMSYLSPDEPCYNPFRCRIVVVGEVCKHCN
jgi:hypothetical protein